MQEPHQKEEPLISASSNLPEFTLKVIVTSAVLAILLAASNAYLALKVGQTVAASIPAAVISMGIFRFFKRSNILENNLVQTAASAGEGLAGATAYILPALIILGFWHEFNYWQTTLLILLGGIFGVFFSVPLRRVLLSLRALHFPEGTAIGNVLKARASGGAQLKNLVRGGLAGGIIVLCQTGFQFLADHLPLWFKTDKTLFGISIGFDPVLIGAGYIIGITASLSMFLGTVFGWIIGVPILSHIYTVSAGTSEDMVMALWSHYIRFMGVGCMLVGGVWTLLTLIKPITTGLITSYKKVAKNHLENKIVLRTRRDIPIKFVLWGIAITAALGFVILWHSIMNSGLLISHGLVLSTTLISILYILIMGFISSLICGYLVGLIGSSNTPLSGILIINVLLLSIILLPLIATQVNFAQLHQQNSAIAVVIFVAAVVGFAAIITNENIQDLKAGQMVGATPWKQQLMMLFGVVVSSLIIAPVLQLLLQAYGMGGVMPRPHMSPAQMLPAPQAGLMAAIGQGFVTHQLPWTMLIVGGVIGIVGIFIDEYLRRKNLRLPVLALGLGIYLPPEIITPTVIGGLIHFLANRALAKRGDKTSDEKIDSETFAHESRQSGILLACGLVAGAALMGVILAIPFVIKGSSDALKLVSNNFQHIAEILSIIVTVSLGWWLYRTASQKK